MAEADFARSISPYVKPAATPFEIMQEERARELQATEVKTKTMRFKPH